MSKIKYFITSALPYANGPIHLGHLAGAYLPADIYVRYRRLNGDDVVYICGTDEHGVPITIRADREKTTPKAIVDKYYENIKNSFARMNIEFDNFSGTSRASKHYELSQKFFLNLYKKGHIIEKEEELTYCINDKMFLPDRYVEGICPYCGYDKARGDQCDKCGKLLNPSELIDIKCALCGCKPEKRKTTHWYLKLQDFEERIKNWITNNKNWKDNVRKFILGWIETEGLKERAITRDLSWGVPVPLEKAKGKVLYVWFDAPIGYISSLIEWAEKIGKPELWKDYAFGENVRMIHFIGKDNIPFHAVIWPAMLMGQDENYVLPYDIPANEYLTLEGDKFSTSLNWAVWVDEYLEEFPADPLRYYLASNSPENKDADFSWKSFQAKNNDELANILGNFANRTLTFIKNSMNGKVSKSSYTQIDYDYFNEISDKVKEIKNSYENFRVRDASKLAMDIARIGNKYFDEMKPWNLKNTNPDRLNTVMNVCLNILRIIAYVFYPIIPESSLKLWKMINEGEKLTDVKWDELLNTKIEDRAISEIEILFVKYDDAKIQKQIDRLFSKSSKSKGESKMDNVMEFVKIEDFKKLDIRVAEVIAAENMEKSNKLLKLKVKVGDKEKQILAGIKQFYKPEDLIGKKIIIINNLEPAKLMGETSEGMLLAASNEDKSKLTLLTVMADIPSGAKIS